VITGPEEGAAAGRAHLRAAHADREHVIDLLKAAFVQGRLTKDELDTRAGQALTARTYAELAALTADIPAGPSDRPPRQPARPENRTTQNRTAQNQTVQNQTAPTHPVRTAAIGSVGCLIVAFLAFSYGAHLDDSNTPAFLMLTLVAVVVAVGFIGCGVGNSWQQRHSRAQLPPGTGQDGQAPGGKPRGSIGHDRSLPGGRTDQTSADLRVHGSRPHRPRPCRRGVPVPRGARPAPGAA
jgi:Domain of unknown function (DUF1707)